MTSAQKIIKNLATAFALFLAFAIISGIVTGIYTIIGALGLDNKKEYVVLESMKEISNEIEEVTSLEINLSYTNLKIKTGEKFRVETNNEKITLTNNNGNVKIKDEGEYILNEENTESNLIVYIPENTEILNEVIIKNGAGKIQIDKLKTEKLHLKMDAGEVNIENLVVTKEIDIDGGVGKTELKHCQLNKLKADLGVGAFNFSGTLTEKSKINSGVGAIDVELEGKKEDYTIKVSKGFGNIQLDGQSIETDKAYGTGDNYLDINGGVGEIKIDFTE